MAPPGNSDPIINLIVLGAEPRDPEIEPRIDAEGQAVLEDGEKLLQQFQWPVEVTAFRSGFKKWTRTFRTEKRIEVLLTSRRLILLHPRWKSDKALGSFVERRVVTTVLERDEGKQILAGHVRIPWLYRVSTTNVTGRLTRTRTVSLACCSEKSLFSLSLLKLDPARAVSLGQEIAKMIANYRLDHLSEIDPEVLKRNDDKSHEQRLEELRQQLQAISDGSNQPEVLDWGSTVNLPGERRISGKSF